MEEATLPPPPRIGDDDFPPIGLTTRQWNSRLQGEGMAEGALVGTDAVHVRLAAMGRIRSGEEGSAERARAQLEQQLGTLLEDLEVSTEVSITVVNQLPPGRRSSSTPATLAKVGVAERLGKVGARLKTLRDLVDELSVGERPPTERSQGKGC